MNCDIRISRIFAYVASFLRGCILFHYLNDLTGSLKRSLLQFV
jgi:hypothetical protein